jgi:F-type H+-transporting ATPase subunit b
MLELELKWFIILVANFLGLLFILNILLFRPMLKVFKERDNTVRSSLDEAKKMSAKREHALSDMQRELQAAKAKAREVFEGLRGEGLSRHKDVVSKAGAEAMALAEKARQEMTKESERARQAMRADIEKLSDRIMEKLVGA